MIRNSASSRAFRVSLVGGITLLLLSLAVFAVAVQARSVSINAEDSIQTTENLRIASISRAELSIASRLAAGELAQVDVIDASIANSLDTLTLLGESLDAAEADAELTAAYDDFAGAATDQASLLRQEGSVSQDNVAAELRTGETFEAFAGLLRERQDAAITGLESSNDLMNLIGSLATFVVAFVVPSAALYVFESLRNVPRHTRELEFEADRVRNRVTAGAMAIQAETQTIRERLFGYEDDDEAESEEALRRSLLRLEHLATANGAMHRWRSEPVDVLAIAHEVRASVGERLIVVESDRKPPLAQGDSVEVALVLNELTRNSLQHGSHPISIRIGTVDDRVVASVIDVGDGLPEVVRTAIFEERDFALRNNLVSGRFGYGLYAARLAAESMHAELRYDRVDERTHISLLLPLASSTEGSVVSEGSRAA
jgi:signal transduction histidine kinase